MDQMIATLPATTLPRVLTYVPISANLYAYACDIQAGMTDFGLFDIVDDVQQQIAGILKSGMCGRLYEVWAEPDTPINLGYILVDATGAKILQDWALRPESGARKALRQARRAICPVAVDIERGHLVDTPYDFERRDGVSRIVSFTVTAVQLAAFAQHMASGSRDHALIIVQDVLNHLEMVSSPFTCAERMVYEMCKEAQCACAQYILIELEEV